MTRISGENSSAHDLALLLMLVFGVMISLTVLPTSFATSPRTETNDGISPLSKEVRDILLSQVLEQLQTMSAETCGHNHHFLWRYGGADRAFCPEAHRSKTMLCNHANTPIFSPALNALDRLGLITNEHSEKLRGVFTGNAGTWRNWRSDNAVLIISRIAYGLLNEENPKKWRDYFRSEVKHLDGLENESIDTLTPQRVEELAVELQERNGAPILRFHALLLKIFTEAKQSEESSQVLRQRFAQEIDNYLKDVAPEN